MLCLAIIDFDHVLSQFINWLSLSTGKPTCWDPRHGHFHTWNKFQLQLHSAFQPQVIMLSRVVQAYPLSDAFPLGNCNTTLVNIMGDDGWSGKFSLAVVLHKFKLFFSQNFHELLT
jgi:hypothetical protein